MITGSGVCCENFLFTGKEETDWPEYRFIRGTEPGDFVESLPVRAGKSGKLLEDR